ncbi:DUF3519 domain-containing protein [Helicobacter pylori]|uniref:DUF3519 domain-containing protein n=1 Tax=Helicobacter pylori TaxID=210 RepID=UPI003CC5D43A
MSAQNPHFSNNTLEIIEGVNSGVKLRLVVDDLNNGNKIFDFYSGRNLTDFRDARPLPSTPIQRDTISKRFNKSRGFIKKNRKFKRIDQRAYTFKPPRASQRQKACEITKRTRFLKYTRQTKI